MNDDSAASNPNASELPVLALVRDLMFASKIGATARSQQAPLRIIRDPQQLAGHTGRRLIVDLNLDGALDAALAWKALTAGEVVGFVSHVDTPTISAAQSAGIDQVLPRSRFVMLLPDLLT